MEEREKGGCFRPLCGWPTGCTLAFFLCSSAVEHLTR